MTKGGTDKIGLNDLMRRAKEMQDRLKDIQEKINGLEINGEAGGGAVKITMTGQHYAKKVVIDPNILKEEKAILEDLIAAAINDCTEKIERNLRDKVSSLSGFKLPEGFEDLNEG